MEQKEKKAVAEMGLEYLAEANVSRFRIIATGGFATAGAAFAVLLAISQLDHKSYSPALYISMGFAVVALAYSLLIAYTYDSLLYLGEPAHANYPALYKKWWVVNGPAVAGLLVLICVGAFVWHIDACIGLLYVAAAVLAVYSYIRDICPLIKPTGGGHSGTESL